MRIRPIRTEREHAAALREIEQLWEARPGTAAHDRLEVLSILVEAYEDEKQAIEPPDPIAAIKFRLDQLGLDRSALESSIGSRGRVSEILAGKRRLTLAMIRRLHRDLGIPAEALLAG